MKKEASMSKKQNLPRMLIRPRTTDDFHRALKLQRAIRESEQETEGVIGNPVTEPTHVISETPESPKPE
jgi:hypothetical protein